MEIKEEKTAKKKQRRFPWISLAFLLMIVGFLAFITIPAYQDYMKRGNWSKTNANIAPLKLAIGECLSDNEGKLTGCDDLGELAKYGITALPAANGIFSAVAIIKDNAAIRVVGSPNLGNCVIDFVPTVNKNYGTVTWEVTPRPHENGGDTLAKCHSYFFCE